MDMIETMDEQNHSERNYNFEVYRATSRTELDALEKQWRNYTFVEYIPSAMRTPFWEVAEKAIEDKNGEYASPLLYYISTHNTEIGSRKLGRKASEFFQTAVKKQHLDILSISTGMENNRLKLKMLVRIYAALLDMEAFFESIGENVYFQKKETKSERGNLIIPDEIKNFSYTKEEIEEHKQKLQKQQDIFKNSSKEKPFLNQLDEYVPTKLKNPSDSIDLIYDMKSKDMEVNLISSYEDYIDVFSDIMRYVSGVEYYNYISAINGEDDPQNFMDFLEDYITDNYIKKSYNNHHIAAEDLPKMMDKVYNALFKLYVVQPLIDDPDVTDIKITAPDAIRARVRGKAYMSNITFVDREDYLRFINGICIRNHISQDIPDQSFTDDKDPNYIIRFSLSAEYANSVRWPYLHIRKIARKKLLGDDLIEAGMLTPKLREYLLDCGKNSRGVVFAGPPGSGKTVCLNWFLEEAYEQSAEILVIQENDELFCYRKGVMFQHVVNYGTGRQVAVSLEELGQLALVAGANVFVIGEAKGAEICSAITLSNSGCRTAITIHSPSSTETLDKMADLAMRGYAQDYNQAKRMLKSFQTIVYLQDFKIMEISEIAGYDEDRKEIIYNYIYRRECEED